MLAYVSGELPKPFALVVATHISMCDTCRASYETLSHVGGALLDDADGVAMSGGAKARLFAQLDTAAPVTPRRSGVFPAPLFEAMGGEQPRWKRLGLGSRQAILSETDEGSTRLLYIPAGQAVPDHGHNGLELTLVLQGAFRDETGRFGVGDVEVAHDDLNHTPVAEGDVDCICLAATDAPLKFNSIVPRLLQPILRI